MIAAANGVMSDKPAGLKWRGTSAAPQGDWLRAQSVLLQLERVHRQETDDGGRK